MKHFAESFDSMGQKKPLLHHGPWTRCDMSQDTETFICGPCPLQRQCMHSGFSMLSRRVAGSHHVHKAGSINLQSGHAVLPPFCRSVCQSKVQQNSESIQCHLMHRPCLATFVFVIPLHLIPCGSSVPHPCLQL